MTTLAMGLALAIGATAASAEKMIDYASVGLASQVYTDSDASNYGFSAATGSTLVAVAGKKMENIHEYFAVEGEFGYNLGAPTTTLGTEKLETSIMTLGAYGNINIPLAALSDKLTLKVRAGMVYHSAETTYTDSDPFCSVGCSVSEKDSGTNFAFGGGLGYQLKNNLDIHTRWMMSGNIINSGIGVGYYY